MNCVFCQIVKEPSHHHVIYEDENFLSFLDIRPLFLGHSLLIPKKHYQTIYDIPPDVLPGVMVLTQILGKAIEEGMGADGLFMASNNKVSQSVPHFHLHLVPRKIKDGLKGFFWPRLKISNEELKAVKESIISKITH